MAKSPELDAAIALLTELGNIDESQGTIEGMRRSFEKISDSFPMEDGVTCERVSAGGVPSEWLTATGSDPARAIIYLHGGGYVIGSVRTHRVMMAKLAKSSGARVLGLEYRLAPEVQFPAPVEDTVAAYRWLLAEGFDPGKIAIAGDSAGGGLVVAAMVQLRYLGEPMPGAAVCFSPWVDLEGIGGSMTSNAEVDPIVQKEFLTLLAGLYIGERNLRTPLAAPMYADLQGLPPMLVQVGSVETLLDDANRLAAAAKAAGVSVELSVWDDMIHVWQLFAPILPEGQRALDQAGDFVKKHTS